MQPIELYEVIRPEILSFECMHVTIHDVQKQGYYTEPHWHEHVELLYVLEGEALFGINQTEICAHKGDLIIANSNDLHSIYCTGKRLKDLVIIFEMEKISKTLAKENILFQTYISNDQLVTDYIEKICKELEDEKAETQLLCKGLIYTLIAELVRHYSISFLEKKDSVKREKRLKRINVVLEYMDRHCAESIENAKLAELMHVSENHFYYLFKETVGMSPRQYVNELRLKKALNLLKEGKYNLTEIASRAGFSDYNNFGRQFRRYYGCTPKEMEKRV